MKSIFLIAVSAALLSACAASGPKTAWGKPGVTKVEYVTDLGTCTAAAAMTQGSGGNSEVAGGMHGQNNSADNGLKQQNTGQPVGTSSPGAAAPIGGSMYRDSAPPDVVNRAANQQQQAEIIASHAKANALKSCYAEHGYKEFTLNAEQRAKLATMQVGSNEYLQYLSTIGADPAVVNAQAIK
jgi:hypothetical protein